MARVLLINPPKQVPLLDWTMRYPPLGLMSIAALIPGHQVEILDMKVEKVGPRNLEARMRSADIVGITVLTPSVDSALELCREAKRCGALTVLGGPHPTLVPVIVENPEVDIVVRGEGELTFREIADGRPLASILGISYADRGSVVHNPDRPPLDLNTLPPPRRDLVSTGRRRYQAFSQSMGAVSTARGCPYRCTFCCVPNIWKGYRELSPRSAVDEIRRMGWTEIVSIVDDNFCHDMRRVEAICDLIISEGLNDRLYSVFSRVDSIVRHPDIVEKMARANMRVVFIGIEAASQAALDRMNKRTRLEDVHRACEILENNGMLIWAGHIIGNLDDTYDDVEALIAMSLRLPIDIADFTVITPYPGTELYRIASKRGLIDEYDFTEYCECEPHMHTPNLSRMEILELEIKAYMKFYGFWRLVRRAHQWSKNPEKRWMVERRIGGYRSFWSFRQKSAFYFWRTYRETVGKTEGTKIRRHSPLVSTPKLYSLGAAIAAAAITLLATVYIGRLYGAYTARPLGFRIVDILAGSAFIAFVVAGVGTWLAVRSCRHGWIFSVRRRRPVKRERRLADLALVSAVLFAVAALAATLLVFLGLSFGGLSAGLTYRLKEILVTAIAFATALFISYYSIQAVRNGGIAG